MAIKLSNKAKNGQKVSNKRADHFVVVQDKILIDAANQEPLICDNTISDFSGYLMAHENWPDVKLFMISPLSRC